MKRCRQACLRYYNSILATGLWPAIKQTLGLLVASLCTPAIAQTVDPSIVEAYLLFHSTFDDTTDANLFGSDNDAGWIYTAESTKRVNAVMQNRCPEVLIAKGDGKIRDCLEFREETKDVLFYQASPNLSTARRNWQGTVSFWLKPNMERLGKEDCYPLLISDGDWNHGGFFVRFPARRPTKFEFGTVSNVDAAQAADFPNAVTKDQRFVTAIDRSRFAKEEWELITFTFENVNPLGQELSVAKIYLNGKLEGQIRQPLNIRWMDPGTPKSEQNAAIFLGINYVGGMDDLRIFKRALSQPQIQILCDGAR